MNAAPLPPVERSVTVRLSPQEAFALFTQRMRQWWPFAAHSLGGAGALGVEFEPRVGGAVTELAGDGRRFLWGTLTAWEPPRRFVMHWHPGQPAEAATTLEVRFTACADGTEVHIVHGGWASRGDAAAAVRGNYDEGWGRVLAALAIAAGAAALGLQDDGEAAGGSGKPQMPAMPRPLATAAGSGNDADSGKPEGAPPAAGTARAARAARAAGAA
ncbi:MAG: SRPBCC domain-containing protein [Burkholderiaceae bacterium]|nr:SRPBCC domain-containing protein [Burkholderiaceae bacterium]